METIQLKKLIYNHYDLDVNNLKKLNGYDTENFLVHCKNESKYILKKVCKNSVKIRKLSIINPKNTSEIFGNISFPVIS